MMLVGLVWAALAPLSLVLLVVLLQRALRARVRGAAWPMALALVLGPVGTRWWLDRREFVAVCRTAGAPVIHRRVAAEGIYLNSGTANSFGMRYLHDEGFAWVEAEDIARRGAWVRYARRASAAGQTAEITTTEIPVLTARYEVRESFRQPLPHTGLAETLVLDRETGDTLARAGKASFDGGRVKWVLGAWGSSDCPSARSAPAAFSAYYHLAQRTLR